MEQQPPFQPDPGDVTSNSITPGVLMPPFEGCWTGDMKLVKLNHLYKGGKLCDMPMYNKSTDVDPGAPLVANKQTVVQALIRNRDPYQS